MKDARSAAAEESSVREYDCWVNVGGIKWGSVTGSSDDHVPPVDWVICTKSTGCLVPGAPKS
jgi:hypothetical protein